MVSVFVGEGRKALVKGIVDRLDNLTDYKGDSRACLVSLEAPSGWGKTRVIQEVYKHIAERQKQSYWPHSIIPEDEDDPVSRRKHLTPSFVGVARDRNVLPEFFWWGLTCDMRSTNMLSRSLTEDIEQLRFHAPYLEASWAASKLTGLGKYATVAKAKSALGALFEEGATTGLAKLAELGLGATPFGIGLGLKLVTSGAKAVKNKKQEQAQMMKGFEAHESSDEGLVEGTVNLLARLAHEDLPIIICIEDIHKATPPVLDLIAKLLAYNAPILILTTTWPGEFEKLEPLQALLDAPWAQDRILRMAYDQPTPKGLPETASLSRLPAKDLGEIIQARYPKVTDDVIALLAARYNNPLPLELVLNMKSLKQDYPYLELDAEDVDKLPETVRDLYNSLWNELPEPVQQLLALSTELMPEGQPEWLMTLISDGLSGFETEDWAKSVSHIAVNDNIPHGWSRIIEGWLRRFGEADQLNIARAHVRELFGKRQLKLFNETAAASLETFDFTEANIDDVEAIHKAWLAVAYFDLDMVSLDTHLSASVFLLRFMEDKPEEWSRAIIVGESLLARTDTRSDITDSQAKLIADAQFYLASIYGDSGNLKGAMAHLKICLKNSISILGEAHQDVLIIRNNIAMWLGQSGALSEALDALQTLLEDVICIFGAEHTNVLRPRNNIAYLLGQSGAVSEAVGAFKALLEDQTRILGAEHPDVLTTRNNIAYLLGESGAVSEAVGAFKALLEDQTRILGSEHLDVLITRSNIASWLGRSGTVSEAVGAYKALLEDYTRILGAKHPDVLITRNNIAFWLGESGAVSEAIEAFKALLEDQTRILGAEHPDVLRTRSNIASWLGQSGAVAEAIEAFKALLEDQTRILGAEHPDVLRTRSNIAFYLEESGALSEALKAFKALLEDQTRILGAEHPDVLITRSNIASWLGRSGAVSEALEAFKALLEDRTRILGAEHPDVLNTRNNIAGYLGESGAVGEALDAFKALLADQIRIMGAKHPHTIDIQACVSHYQKKLDEQNGS